MREWIRKMVRCFYQARGEAADCDSGPSRDFLCHEAPPVCLGYLPNKTRDRLALEAALTRAGIFGGRREMILDQFETFRRN